MSTWFALLHSKWSFSQSSGDFPVVSSQPSLQTSTLKCLTKSSLQSLQWAGQPLALSPAQECTTKPPSLSFSSLLQRTSGLLPAGKANCTIMSSFKSSAKYLPLQKFPLYCFSVYSALAELLFARSFSTEAVALFITSATTVNDIREADIPDALFINDGVLHPDTRAASGAGTPFD